MLVVFQSESGGQQVSLLLPNPASEDPIDVSLSLDGVVTAQRAVASIYIELAEFAIEASALPDGWHGKTSFSSLEDDFVILCRARRGEFLLLEFVMEFESESGNSLAKMEFAIPCLTMADIGNSVSTWVKQC